MRSPVRLGIVLGLVVGAGAVAAIATTSSSSPPKAAVLQPATTNPGDPQGYGLRYDPAPGSIERLAAAFDLHAAVATDADGWVVRDGDRVLRVQRSAGLPWFLATSNPACVLVPEEPPSSEPLQTVPPSGPMECPDTRPGEVLSQDDALALGKDTLIRAGLGASTTDIVDEPGGWYIQASPEIDGKPTAGLQWTISIGPGRLVSAASGYLAVEDR